MKIKRSRPETARGFTLIEMMVVVGLIGIMAGLAISGMQGMLPRIKGTRSIAEMVGMFSQASRLAAAGQSTVWIGIEDPGAGTAPYAYVMVEDWDGDLDHANFDPANPGASFVNEDVKTGEGKRRDRILLQGELYRNVQYYAGSTLDAAGAATLPSPYKDAVLDSNGQCSAYDATTTTACAVSPTNKMAWIQFLPSGRVRLPADPTAKYVTMILGLDTAGNASEKTAIILALPYGLVETYSDA